MTEHEGAITPNITGTPPKDFTIVLIERIDENSRWECMKGDTQLLNTLSSKPLLREPEYTRFLRYMRWLEMCARNAKAYVMIEGEQFFQYKGYRWPVDMYSYVADGFKP